MADATPDVKNPELKEVRKIDASIKYEIIIFEDDKGNQSMQWNYERTAENELVALLISKSIAEYQKEMLKESVNQAKGKSLNMVKDRLNRVAITESHLQNSITSVIGMILNPVEEPVVPSAETEDKEACNEPEDAKIVDLSAHNDRVDV